MAKQIGKPINELAINWLRQKEEVTCIIGGSSSIAQLDKNVEAAEWDIPDETLAQIDEIIAPFEDK